MRTEARRSFSHGFVLTETELRRLIDEISDQMRQMCTENEFSVSYEIKFMNGAVAEPLSIDEITSEENHGSGRISRVRISAAADRLEKTEIIISFSDPGEESDEWKRSISYSVEADNKDWVFVTSSKIEERIDKIKRVPLLSFFRGRGPQLALPIIMMIAMFSGMVSVSSQKSRAISLLEDRINRGELSDPILALLEMQKAQIDAGWFGMSIEMTMMAIMVFLILILVGSVGFLSYAYPAYNFCWGDYTETYRRRKVLGNTVLSAVVLALVIGVTANYISRFIP